MNSPSTRRVRRRETWVLGPVQTTSTRGALRVARLVALATEQTKQTSILGVASGHSARHAPNASYHALADSRAGIAMTSSVRSKASPNFAGRARSGAESSLSTSPTTAFSSIIARFRRRSPPRAPTKEPPALDRGSGSHSRTMSRTRRRRSGTLPRADCRPCPDRVRVKVGRPRRPRLARARAPSWDPGSRVGPGARPPSAPSESVAAVYKRAPAMASPPPSSWT